ncbi:MAG: gliding motility lipoprotein GldD [Bacteroidia bacterium]
MRISTSKYQKGIIHTTSSKNSISWVSLILFSFITIFLLPFFSCNDGVISPKPRAYFRILFPEKKYVQYKSDCPFSFEIPTYSTITNDKDKDAEPCWLNLNFPNFKGTVHLTYKVIHNDIDSVLEKTYLFVAKHQIKASSIEEQVISKKASNVYGLIYSIDGNAASPVQFFLTDSVHNYIRGALYFSAIPNTDSIAPVLEFVRADINRLIETFEWVAKPTVLPKVLK